MKEQHNRTPREIVKELDRYIIGQDAAKKAIAVALRNRYRRQKLDADMQKEVTPKNNSDDRADRGRKDRDWRDAWPYWSKTPFVKVEATKFTEVGYVGRDVESMVRDLMENAIQIVEKQKRSDVYAKAYEAALERLSKVMRPGTKKAKPKQEGMNDWQNMFKNLGMPLPESQEEEVEEVTAEIAKSRAEIIEQLRKGLLNKREVSIKVEEKQANPLGGGGNNEQMMMLQSAFESMTPKKKIQRTLLVEDAIEVLVQEETDKLVNKDDISQEALKLAETNGIIFIDEIDKITSKSQNSGEVSREGVQRDILPIVEGSQVSTKYGTLQTDHILFIASGAFHVSKPSDLIPELQGRFPIRVELNDLTEDDFVRILTEPNNAMLKQYTALLATEDVDITFTQEAIRKMAAIATEVNQETDNIGARRLHTIMEKLLEDLLFEASEIPGTEITITEHYVDEKLEKIVENKDLRRYIL